MSVLEYARHLLGKARQDELVVEKLVADPEISDEVLGFHAQQAVEKVIKAVLTAHGVPFRRTHDLTELIDLLRDFGIGFPQQFEEVRLLSPFAVEFRYDDLPVGEDELFDRAGALGQVREVRQWASELIAFVAARNA